MRNLKITGNLTVNTPGATVNNSASVDGTITIQDVSGSTWNENASGNKLVFSDPNAGTNLVIGASNTVASLTLNTSAMVTVSTGATVTELIVDSGAANSEITNNGTVTDLTANAAVKVSGNTPENVTGNGNLSGDAVLTAPVDGLTTADVLGVTNDGAKFLVFGLNESEEVQKQKPSTLAEIKSFMSTKYDVNFNTDAIKVTDGKIEIIGSILSTADWNKVKANGDDSSPYRITLLADNSTNKVLKIAMYQDGKAVFNNVDNSLYTGQ